MYTGNIDNDLKILIPSVVAETISMEHAGCLVKLARHFYARNSMWARRITDSNVGRDTLYAFMRHWLDGYERSGRWINDTEHRPL